MNLHATNTLRRLRRVPVWRVGFALAIIVVVEVLGRVVSRSDLYDAVAFTALMTAVLMIRAAHREHRFTPLSRLGDWLRGVRRRVGPIQIDYGVDLRRTPPIPARVPRCIIVTSVLAVVLLGAVVAVLWLVEPTLRSVAVRVLYVGYVGLLGALWATLLAIIALGLLLPTACIHDAFVSRFTGPRPRPLRPELIALAAYFLGVLAAAPLLPAWVGLALAAAAVAIVVLAAWTPPWPRLRLLWLDPTRRVWSTSWRVVMTCWILVLVQGLLAAVLAAGAGPGPGASSGELPVTGTLGVIAAWVGGAGFAVPVGGMAFAIASARVHTPARPVPATVYLDGPAGLRRRARCALRDLRWRVRRATRRARSLDVALTVVPSAGPVLDRGEVWPLAVDAASLRSGDVRALLVRRDVVQRRRHLVRGMEKLFKRAARARFRSGCGFWFAPQHWFIAGMSRDSSEQDLDSLREETIFRDFIGAPYRTAFARSARSHWCEVLRVLDVDLIFVEDGVGVARFRRIMHRMFEHYDDGAGRLEEAHLTGMNGVRALVCDFEIDMAPRDDDTYPEPDYEDLGRARVLHIYRDRGDPDEPDESPLVDTGVPVSTAV